MPTPVEDIKSKLDIVDLVQEYVPLKQSGANFKGLCPFHNEKTPSFMVSRERQFFKCFGCGEGGDIFTFLQKMENLEFPEALKILAEKAGVKIVRQNYNPAFENLKTKLYNLHETAVQFYQEQLRLPTGRSALDYLLISRGLTENILKEFQIGLAPNTWDMLSKFLKTQGFSDQEIKQSGLVVEKTGGYSGLNYYDRFRNRIMFPILDHHGNIVGFTARALDKNESAKYINTPQTLIYNKSQVLYGLDKAKSAIREKGYVILVEGNMDVVASYKAGVKNVVASSGTSLTQDQLKNLKRYTENLALCFDADSAGIKAAERGVDLIWANSMNVKVIILPEKFKDPDELVKVNSELWVTASQKLINFMDYLLAVNLANQNWADIDAKRQITAKILPWISKLENPIETDHYLKELAKKLNIAESSLMEVLQKMRVPKTKIAFGPKESADIVIKINKQKIVSERLLALLINSSDFLAMAIDKLAPEMIFNDYQEFYKELIFYYTKNNVFEATDFLSYLSADKKNLVFLADTLKLLFESEFANLSRLELNQEFNLSLNFLKREKITGRLKEIEADLRLAERDGDRAKADLLMQEFSELSRDMN